MTNGGMVDLLDALGALRIVDIEDFKKGHDGGGSLYSG